MGAIDDRVGQRRHGRWHNEELREFNCQRYGDSSPGLMAEKRNSNEFARDVQVPSEK